MKYVPSILLLAISLSVSCKKQSNDTSTQHNTTYIDQSKIKQYAYRGMSFDSSYITDTHKDSKTVSTEQTVTLTYNYIDSTLSIWGVYKPLVYPMYGMNDIPFGRDIIIKGDSFKISQAYISHENSGTQERSHIYTFKGKK